MRFRKFFAIVLSAFMMLTNVSVIASAETVTYASNEGIAPAFEYATSARNTLKISANTANCSSNCTGSSDVVSVSVVHTLQKYWSLWVWNDVAGASWSKTDSGTSVALVNNKSGLTSGTYRLKSVFTLTSSNGKTETITIYSEEKTI